MSDDLAVREETFTIDGVSLVRRIERRHPWTYVGYLCGELVCVRISAKDAASSIREAYKRDPRRYHKLAEEMHGQVHEQVRTP